MASSIENHLRHCSTLCTAPVWPFLFHWCLRWNWVWKVWPPVIIVIPTVISLRALPMKGDIHMWTSVQEMERWEALRVAELNKEHLFWWLKKRWLGAVQNDGQKRERLGKSVQLGMQPVMGAYWGNVLGRPGGEAWVLVHVCCEIGVRHANGYRCSWILSFSVWLFLHDIFQVLQIGLPYQYITQKKHKLGSCFGSNVSALQKSRIDYMGN